MIEVRQHLRLSLEALAKIRLFFAIRAENFDGNKTGEPLVTGAVHFPHSARADAFENSIASEAAVRFYQVRGPEVAGVRSVPGTPRTPQREWR